MLNPRKFLNSLFEIAVEKALPRECIPPFLPKSKIHGRMVVFGAGKASASMAEVVEQNYSANMEGLVVTRYGHSVPCNKIEIIEAGHPIPDNNGMLGASKMLKLASELKEEDMVICLISGGGSSLLSLPAPGLNLRHKQKITSDLLRSGATIHEINVIRKHLSSIKGGRLAIACYPAKIITLAISDVSGDDMGVIASGPTYEDSSTFADALKILQKYKITNPKSVLDYLKNATDETPKPGDYRLENVENYLVATSKNSLEASAKFAEQSEVIPLILSDRVEGESREVGRIHALKAIDLQKKLRSHSKPLVLLSGGETCVTVKGSGLGGPNTEYLLSMLIELKGQAGISAIACDTDGIDGLGDNAGAFISPDSLTISESLGLNPLNFLTNNDSYNFFSKLRSLISPGPTLTNVSDFRAILITPL
tara:strand:+ start:1415 stop:2683 length:1269 start_codon:yes stop_codon:yes gene_type:complete